MNPHAPTLLVIEDAADQAVLVGVAARRAHPGLKVHTCEDGLDGITYLAGIEPYDDRRIHPMPDLIILDLFMPELDGFEVLRWMGEKMDENRPPVVVLTSSHKMSDEIRALELGAKAVYAKPMELIGLGEAVREIVDRFIGAREIIAAHIWAAG